MADNGSIAFTKTQNLSPKSGGTLPYMAPELHEGKAKTPQSDMYAFGCVCYEVSLDLTVDFTSNNVL